MRDSQHSLQRKMARRNIQKTNQTIPILLMAIIYLCCNLAEIVHCKATESGSFIMSNTTNNSPTTNTTKKIVCSTPLCDQRSTLMMNSMNVSADPCDNFYEFTCGNFVRNDNISDRGYKSATDGVMAALKGRLIDMLQEPIDVDEIQPFVVLKQFYNSCRNNRDDERSEDFVLTVLNDYGGWPVLDWPYWNEDGFEWEQTTYNLKNNGFPHSYFMKVSLQTDPRDTSRQIIALDHAEFVVSMEVLTGGRYNDRLKNYFQRIVGVAHFLGADHKWVNDHLEKSLEIEITLAENSVQAQSHNETLITVEELKNRIPNVPWLEYINNMSDANVQVSNNDTILVKSLDYLDKLAELLTEKTKQQLANYVMWQIAKPTFDFLIRRFDKSCLQVVTEMFPWTIGLLYENEYGNIFRTNRAEMVDKIRWSVKKHLLKTDKMDESARIKVLNKLDSLNVVMGYPVDLMNYENLTRYYKDLEIDQGNYQKSLLNVWLYPGKNSRNELHIKSHLEKLNHYLSTKTSYFNENNTIVFPSPMFDGIFYSNSLPNYLNYGAIGFLLSREFVHAFDALENQHSANYKNQEQCFINQYNQYEISELDVTLNGTLTLRENLADLFAIRNAYNAYIDKINHQEKQLPKFQNYTSNQMFWISYGTMMCTKYNSQYMKKYMEQPQLSPSEFRVIGPLSNLEEFSRDFKCSDDSKMKTKNKCSIW